MSHPVVSSFAIEPSGLRSVMSEWCPILLGLLALYVPTFYDLANGIWANEEQAHGPIILVLSLWLLYRQWPWPRMMEKSEGKPASSMGWVVFVIALLLYVIGRSQQILIFEMGSFVWMLAAILLIKRGSSALKALWFPLFFMLFMISLPFNGVN